MRQFKYYLKACEVVDAMQFSEQLAATTFPHMEKDGRNKVSAALTVKENTLNMSLIRDEI